MNGERMNGGKWKESFYYFGAATDFEGTKMNLA